MPLPSVPTFAGKYRWLSNFAESPLSFGDIVFPTVEHAYQAAKSEDPAVWAMFAKLPNAGTAKSEGSKINLRPGWDEMKIEVMRELIQAKFLHLDLRAKLLLTGDAELIEGNYWGDRFWGVDLKTNQGANNLGKLLMEERARLAKLVADQRASEDVGF